MLRDQDIGKFILRNKYLKIGKSKKNMTKFISDIKLRETASAYVIAPFDEGKEILENKGYKIISLEENARLRMQEGTNEDISICGNWVREGVLYIPKKGKFLAKISPIITNAKQATTCHRDRKEFYLTSEQVEQFLADSIELSKKSIPTDRFAEDKIAVYFFEDIAEEYGQFLKEAGINEMSIWTDNLQDKPFIRQAWFDGFRNESKLGGYMGLNGNGRVRGICKGAKNFETYTIAQIKEALKNANLSNIEKILFEKLNK